jgi:hypothetical protein
MIVVLAGVLVGLVGPAIQSGPVPPVGDPESTERPEPRESSEPGTEPTSTSPSNRPSPPEEIPEAQPALFQLTIETEPADARVSLVNKPTDVIYPNDAKSRGIALEAGPVHIRIVRDGYETLSKTVDLARNRRFTARLCEFRSGPKPACEPIEKNKMVPTGMVRKTRQPVTEEVSAYELGEGGDRYQAREIAKRLAERSVKEQCDERSGKLRAREYETDCDFFDSDGTFHCSVEVKAPCETVQENEDPVLESRPVVVGQNCPDAPMVKECPAVQWDE